ncbi:hypothetical protein D3C85_858500 [compost metagenome]
MRIESGDWLAVYFDQLVVGEAEATGLTHAVTEDDVRDDRLVLVQIKPVDHKLRLCGRCWLARVDLVVVSERPLEVTSAVAHDEDRSGRTVTVLLPIKYGHSVELRQTWGLQLPEERRHWNRRVIADSDVDRGQVATVGNEQAVEAVRLAADQDHRFSKHTTTQQAAIAQIDTDLFGLDVIWNLVRWDFKHEPARVLVEHFDVVDVALEQGTSEDIRCVFF